MSKEEWARAAFSHHAGKQRVPFRIVCKAKKKGGGKTKTRYVENKKKGPELSAGREGWGPCATTTGDRIDVTVLGGAGSLDDISDLVGRFGIIGAAAGSLFVFKGKYRAVLINYPTRQQKLDLCRDAMGISV